MICLEQEGKVINYSLYGGESIFKGVKKSPYELETTYCTNCENCKLYKRGSCLKVGRLITGDCPYGNKVVTVGKSPQAKSYYDLKHKYYSYPEEIRSCLKDCKDYIAEIDDEYIFLNINYIDIYKKEDDILFLGCWINAPDGYERLTSSGLLYTQGAVVKKELLNVNNLRKLLETKPRSLMGGEIKDYQEKIVPLLKESILRIFPDMAKELGIEKVSHIGMKALLTTLTPNITFRVDNKDYYWDGEYVTADVKNVSVFSRIGAPVGNVTLKASNTYTVKIEDESWCNENTIYVR